MTNTARRWELRQRTATAHAAVDSAIGAFHSLEDYRRYLAAMHAFRKPLELSLGERAATLVGLPLNRLLPELEADMADLGVEPLAMARPPEPQGRDELLGMLYVLEGSTLGAQLLYRRALALGLTATCGARHLAVQSGAMSAWGAFLGVLDEVDGFDLDSATRASLATFKAAEAAFKRA